MSLDVNLEYRPDDSFGPASDLLEEHGFGSAAAALRQVMKNGSTIVYDANITHNLNTMADQAGIYKALWRPEESDWTKAREIAPLLREGLAKLKTDPAHYRQFNPSNGWGDYEGLVEFVEKYLVACEEHPEATVIASR